MRNGREEERSEKPGYFPVDMFHLRSLYVELSFAYFVYCIVLDQKYSICVVIDCSQTKNCVVGLEDDLT